jgi:hypothetical protein
MEHFWTDVLTSITGDAALINPDFDDRTHLADTAQPYGLNSPSTRIRFFNLWG